MKATCLYLLAIVVAVISFAKYSDGHYITAENSDLTKNDQQIVDSLSRQKRQLEDFDNQYPTAEGQEGQEEPSFWDRVIKVALKMFNKFVEWLNS